MIQCTVKIYLPEHEEKLKLVCHLSLATTHTDNNARACHTTLPHFDVQTQTKVRVQQCEQKKHAQRSLRITESNEVAVAQLGMVH